MIHLGRNNALKINRTSDFGLYLADEEGTEVLLPNKYVPEEYAIGQYLNVFVFKDHMERLTATTLSPGIMLGEFAFLPVVEVNDTGAFVDWGLEKQLLVPYREQKFRMEVGRSYVVYLDIDEKTDRLFGTTKLGKHLIPCVRPLEHNEPVRLLIFGESDLGYSAIVDNKYQGLIYRNEVFTPIKVGQFLKGYVKQVREDGKLDLSLQPIGYVDSIEGNAQLLLKALDDAGGFLPLTDKTDPDVIYTTLGLSKKAFKKAVGDLYRKRVIAIVESGLRKNA